MTSPQRDPGAGDEQAVPEHPAAPDDHDSAAGRSGSPLPEGPPASIDLPNGPPVPVRPDLPRDRDPERSTAAARIQQLLGGPPVYTIGEVAQLCAIGTDVVTMYWRALGFPDPDPDAKHFTVTDVAALRAITGLVASGQVSQQTAQNLVRAQGHSMDRLVLWQTEALVEDAAKRFGLDDTSARLVTLDRLGELAPVLAEQAEYVWRRQLAALMSRIDREVSLSHQGDRVEQQLPLERAIGFIDMISYTTRSATLSADDLSALVQEFESTARDVIASYGARVVKTIGDAVLWVADDLVTGAWVGTGLLASMAEHDLPIRGSLVWGRVLSRSGDVFGPIVNLASRLGDVATEGMLLMDDVSAALLQESDREDDFLAELGEAMEVPGLGTVTPALLRRRI
ncbi:MAG TPA: adenylate/guanylate cyclase domain-containing protein [Beutenbergiaceae bacterium]|nr:adenylate/guanylate cyclase domain-containing protein [Beutenbergiaceae bacterium]